MLRFISASSLLPAQYVRILNFNFPKTNAESINEYICQRTILIFIPILCFNSVGISLKDMDGLRGKKSLRFRSSAALARFLHPNLVCMHSPEEALSAETCIRFFFLPWFTLYLLLMWFISQTGAVISASWVSPSSPDWLTSALKAHELKPTAFDKDFSVKQPEQNRH